MKKNILFVFGTRPEAIKMAPLIRVFNQHVELFDTKVAVTAQHREMLDQVLDFFDIRPDYDLNLMQPGQTLAALTARLATGLDDLYRQAKPDYVVVQGDTTTAFMGAMIGFYHKARIVHIEAGLRSGQLYAPFPEEVNRRMTGVVTFAHMAPTQKAKKNLLAEGYEDHIYITGNTVIDALLLGLEILDKKPELIDRTRYGKLDLNKRIILVTGHRRESFGEGFEHICEAIAEVKSQFEDVEFIYPVHLNPNVREPVNRILGNVPGVHLVEPLDYPHLIWLMKRCYLVLTDSGGIQEEAPSLGKPVLVMREVTERQEGVDAGTARLVGTDKSKIIDSMTELLTRPAAYEAMSGAINPYGVGKAAERVLDIMRKLVDDVMM